MSIYTCEICNKTFSSALALAGHKRMHGGSNGKLPPIKCCCIITKKELPVRDLIRFQTNLKYCLHCNTPLTKKYQTKFCCGSCAASYNNRERIINGYVVSEKHKIKTSTTLKEKIKVKSPRRCEPDGPFSKIFFKYCEHCNTLFCGRIQRKYCHSCAPLYEKTYRERFKFTFNVYKYPDLFDLEYITKIGWYSRGGNAGVWNPDGLSRDHKVSVNDAIKNNYDPFYISHPLNCEIMPWIENIKKNSKSSISYAELILMVDLFESARQH